MVEPLSEAVSTRINSGFVSNLGTLAGEPGGKRVRQLHAWLAEGRANPGQDTEKDAVGGEVAAASSRCRPWDRRRSARQHGRASFHIFPAGRWDRQDLCPPSPK